MPSLEDVFRRIGPALTTELIAEMAKDGLSAAAARQRIARADDFTIKRLAGLRFPHNARFLYLDDQFGDKKYWKALERVFRNHGKSYWGAISGLKARGGIFPRRFFEGVCGTPAARSRQLSPQRVFDRLSAINLLEEIYDDATNETYVKFRPLEYSGDTITRIRARLVAENVVLHGMKEWFRRTGFGSFDKVRVRGEGDAPMVSSITWDLSAPSYARPLVSSAGNGLKPGFIVCDVNLRDVLSEDAVAAFVRKHDLASAPANVAPIMPFLVADGFAGKAFGLARSRGILATTTSHLFGEEVAKALRDLIALLTDTGATASVNPDHIERVLKSLTRIEGAANNLRGALFEIIVGSLAKDVEGGYLRSGEKWKDYETGRTAETDVLLDRPHDKGPLVIECKAKIPGGRVNLEEVQKWREDRVPLLHKIFRTDGRLSGRHVTFELWTNGPIGADALAWLEAYPATKDYSVGWKDGDALKPYVEQASSAAIRRAMSEHYFHHPLAKIAAQVARETGAVRPSQV
ncbi:hypothetical protein XH81_09675 [Bradyrhizobium sp. CCBAU 25360]|uniref:hypothetical protein n=1 Tax=Bradyrhizobium sp. CCBAU 25360 TaxID=858425 RepID=UPI002306CC0A|nr:hypothetical protein [Bradyrhizobium sp. CCBAU 25360]MDA9415113.1 hypothetical protein [Bradyrhizobium sp. CCBAU 25360]